MHNQPMIEIIGGTVTIGKFYTKVQQFMIVDYYYSCTLIITFSIAILYYYAVRTIYTYYVSKLTSTATPNATYNTQQSKLHKHNLHDNSDNFRGGIHRHNDNNDDNNTYNCTNSNNTSNEWVTIDESNDCWIDYGHDHNDTDSFVFNDDDLFFDAISFLPDQTSNSSKIDNTVLLKNQTTLKTVKHDLDCERHPLQGRHLSGEEIEAESNYNAVNPTSKLFSPIGINKTTKTQSVVDTRISQRTAADVTQNTIARNASINCRKSCSEVEIPPCDSMHVADATSDAYRDTIVTPSRCRESATAEGNEIVSADRNIQTRPLELPNHLSGDDSNCSITEQDVVFAASRQTLRTSTAMDDRDTIMKCFMDLHHHGGPKSGTDQSDNIIAYSYDALYDEYPFLTFLSR
jgi:hypothetical protein